MSIMLITIYLRGERIINMTKYYLYIKHTHENDFHQMGRCDGYSNLADLAKEARYYYENNIEVKILVANEADTIQYVTVANYLK